MAVWAAYLIFVGAAMLCFARLPLRAAILLVTIGGWWVLPVGNYGPGADGTGLPWWITGIALPSDMLVTKAWVPPLTAFIGAAIRDPQSLRDWRPRLIDLPMAAWCVWPLIDGLGSSSTPTPWISAAYVTGSWGMSWLIGRIWLSGPDGHPALVRAIALSGLANLPVAVIEGARPPMLYGLLYGPHPFRFDGISRHFGFRPIGFLENGNLYGLWAALAAFAAVWLVRGGGETDRRWIALAVVNVVVALASQSAGAIILLAFGLVLLLLWRLPIFVPLMTALAALCLLVAAVHLSGIIPIQSLARTSAGQTAIGAMRKIGRGSFLWRVSQDVKSLPSIKAHPVAGTAQWDWWRPFGTRPWGQAVLLVGQYGLVGLLLAWGALLAACADAFLKLRQTASQSDLAALPLAIIVLLTLADATLNAFFFFPAILAAGSIIRLTAAPKDSADQMA